jgi:uncharacterized protein YndB with AHSA1/START domain
MEPREFEFNVSCSPEHAFEVWATKTTQWWPRDHSISADPELTVCFEARVGGRIFERTSDGIEHDWGEVLEWDPPHRLSYLWHIYGDRSDATEVEVTFTGVGDATTVTIVHRGWERLGARGPELKRRNHHSWESVLPHYRSGIRNLPSHPSRTEPN